MADSAFLLSGAELFSCTQICHYIGCHNQQEKREDNQIKDTDMRSFPSTQKTSQAQTSVQENFPDGAGLELFGRPLYNTSPGWRLQAFTTSDKTIVITRANVLYGKLDPLFP